MVKFKMDDSTDDLLKRLDLEYQYLCLDNVLGGFNRNRFSSLDGKIVLEVSILEYDGSCEVLIEDFHGRYKYSSLSVDELMLLIINIGGTCSPRIPFIFVRILNGRHLLHHSEYKQRELPE